jgi:hypothetical protein
MMIGTVYGLNSQGLLCDVESLRCSHGSFEEQSFCGKGMLTARKALTLRCDVCLEYYLTRVTC